MGVAFLQKGTANLLTPQPGPTQSVCAARLVLVQAHGSLAIVSGGHVADQFAVAIDRSEQKTVTVRLTVFPLAPSPHAESAPQL